MNFRRFDLFPKYRDPDVKVKTNSGAFLSICTIAAMLILFIHELYRFVVPRIFDDVIVDTSSVGLGRTMLISFNLSIAMPCSKVHFNAFDFEGNPQITSTHNSIHQIRVDENGYSIEDKRWIQIKQKEAIKADKKKRRNEKYCGSCYGAAPKDKCCNSCDDVIAAFKAKGWGTNGIDRWSQCIEEGYADLGKESCITFGDVRVSRVSGTLYFAIDDATPGEKRPMDISRISNAINFSHTINYFEIGPRVSGRKNPLDGLTVIQDNPGRIVYNYELEVVPTKWVSRRNFPVNTYKFQPMISRKNLTEKMARGVPGVFFHYNIAPISIVSNETCYSFWKFLTSCCAIIGGCFACASIADKFLFSALNTIEGKRSIGKAE